MKSFVASIIALVAIGIGTYLVLENKFQMSADQKFTTGSARIDVGTH